MIRIICVRFEYFKEDNLEACFSIIILKIASRFRKNTPTTRNPRRATKPKEKKQRPNKIVWPDVLSLVDLCRLHGYTAVGRMLGVSDNAIRKRIRKFGGSLGE